MSSNSCWTLPSALVLAIAFIVLARLLVSASRIQAAFPLGCHPDPDGDERALREMCRGMVVHAHLVHAVGIGGRGCVIVSGLVLRQHSMIMIHQAGLEDATHQI